MRIGRLWIVIGVVVAVLAVVVISVMPSHVVEEPAANASDSGPTVTSSEISETGASHHRIGRPADATVELGVLTNMTEEDLTPIVDPETLADHLSAEICGDACESVAAMMADSDSFETEVVKATDWPLPPSDTMDTVGPGLSREERARVHQLLNVVVVRAHSPGEKGQIALRTAFAVTSILANQLSGFVYDEVLRRIETAQEFSAHVVTEPIELGAFRPDRIVVQSYRLPDGAQRLVTLGMVRYGAPDLDIKEAPAEDQGPLAAILNALAKRLADGAEDAPLELEGLEVNGAKPKTRATIDFTEPEHEGGDPDNVMRRVVPEGGATKEGYASLVRSLFSASVIGAKEHDADLDAIADHAKKTLDRAIRDAKRGGHLLLKANFAVPDAGGAREESMWIDSPSCSQATCEGTLANDPGFAVNLVSGEHVKVARKDVVDWMIAWGDGGTTGGESITKLRERGAE